MGRGSCCLHSLSPPFLAVASGFFLPQQNQAMRFFFSILHIWHSTLPRSHVTATG